jgi:hypothetical protein
MPPPAPSRTEALVQGAQPVPGNRLCFCSLTRLLDCQQRPAQIARVATFATGIPPTLPPLALKICTVPNCATLSPRPKAVRECSGINMHVEQGSAG